MIYPYFLPKEALCCLQFERNCKPTAVLLREYFGHHSIATKPCVHVYIYIFMCVGYTSLIDCVHTHVYRVCVKIIGQL